MHLPRPFGDLTGRFCGLSDLGKQCCLWLSLGCSEVRAVAVWPSLPGCGLCCDTRRRRWKKHKARASKGLKYRWNSTYRGTTLTCLRMLEKALTLQKGLRPGARMKESRNAKSAWSPRFSSPVLNHLNTEDWALGHSVKLDSPCSVSGSSMWSRSYLHF